MSQSLNAEAVYRTELTFRENVQPPPCVTCQVSYVTCHVSDVMCQVSHVRCQVSLFFFLQRRRGLQVVQCSTMQCSEVQCIGTIFP